MNFMMQATDRQVSIVENIIGKRLTPISISGSGSVANHDHGPAVLSQLREDISHTTGVTADSMTRWQDLDRQAQNEIALITADSAPWAMYKRIHDSAAEDLSPETYQKILGPRGQCPPPRPGITGTPIRRKHNNHKQRNPGLPPGGPGRAAQAQPRELLPHLQHLLQVRLRHTGRRRRPPRPHGRRLPVAQPPRTQRRGRILRKRLGRLPRRPPPEGPERRRPGRSRRRSRPLRAVPHRQTPHQPLPRRRRSPPRHRALIPQATQPELRRLREQLRREAPE